MKIEIMDTTLRDGEQTSGVSFAAQEKLSVVRLLLDDLKVDRVEIASARVSAGEFESVRRIGIWARRYNMLDRVEILGFIDKGLSLKWVKDAGMKVINLLTKGSSSANRPNNIWPTYALKSHCARNPAFP
jgi:(R)-citramalate synthase